MRTLVRVLMRALFDAFWFLVGLLLTGWVLYPLLHSLRSP